MLYCIAFGIAVLKLMLVRSPMQVWKASGEYISITQPFDQWTRAFFQPFKFLDFEIPNQFCTITVIGDLSGWRPISITGNQRKSMNSFSRGYSWLAVLLVGASARRRQWRRWKWTMIIAVNFPIEKLITAHGQLFCSHKVSTIICRTDLRITNHRGHKFPSSVTLLTFKARIKCPPV